jgi:hypothetical protein
MAERTAFQKAKLEIEGGGTLECWLNPSQYAITKANDWTTRPVVGASLPQAQFGGGHARELTLELLFDGGPNGDVSPATDQLFAMMEVDANLAQGRTNHGRPPTITLSWGSFKSFKAVCRHLNVRFELFRPDGTPIRARADLTLVQVEKDAKTGRGTPARAQNPTSRATGDTRQHTVQEGDSLPSIAFSHFGDPARWPEIAAENGIDDPLRLHAGAKLRIPAGSAA